MPKTNFRQRRRALIKQHRAITDQIELLGRPRNDDERKLLRRLDVEEGLAQDAIWNLEDLQLKRRIRSRHAILSHLIVMKSREGLALPMGHHIDELIAKIEEWRAFEPVLCPDAGRVNA